MAKKDKDQKLNKGLIAILILFVLSIVSIVAFKKDLGYEFNKGTIYEFQPKGDIEESEIVDRSKNIDSRSNVQKLEDNYSRIYLNGFLEESKLKDLFGDITVENSETRFFQTNSVLDDNILQKSAVLLISVVIFLVLVFTNYKAPITKIERVVFLKLIITKSAVLASSLVGIAFMLNSIKFIDLGFTAVELIIAITFSYILIQVVEYFDFIQNFITIDGESLDEKHKSYLSVNKQLITFITIAFALLASTIFIFTSPYIMTLITLIVLGAVFQLVDIYFLRDDFLNSYLSFSKKLPFIKNSKFWNKSN